MNESEQPNVPSEPVSPASDPAPSSPPVQPDKPAQPVAPAAATPTAAPAPSASTVAPAGDAAGGASGGEGAPEGHSSEGGSATESDGKRRRRRRRRRRAARAEGEPGEPSTSGEGSDALAADPSAADQAASGDQANSGDKATAGDQATAGDKAAAGGGKRAPRSKKRGSRGRDREPRNQDARGRGKHDRRRGKQDSQHSATVAVRALADMAQALLHIEGVDPLAMPRYLDLNLRVPLDGGNDIRHAAGTAVEQILQRVREVREHEQALRPGAVYSYFADSSHAEGCRPTEPRHVFDGYSSTGKPKFTDFVTLAIERKDAQIERMLAGEEIILTHVTMGRVLRTQQLAEFGEASPVFKILGQVDAGLFPVLGEAGRCAFSFQLLRGQTLEGRVRLRLHPVGAVDPMDLADPALMQILSRFQRKLDTEALRLEGKLKSGEVDEEEFVLPLLQDLAKQLQSRTRNTGRRTQHGLERSEGGQRPTSRAYPDAGEASDSKIFWDVDQSTICVVGGKGRVHVFSPQAKHITSVVMQGQAIERRRQQGRWRLADPEERGEFRIQLKRLVAAGEDQPTEEDGAAPPAVAPATDKPANGAPSGDSQA